MAGAAEVPEQRVRALASQLSEHEQGLGPVCANRHAWTASRVVERTTEIRRAAEKLLAQNFPAWDLDQYLEYSSKGTRPNGERMMNARKAWLYPLTVAECVEGKRRFIPAIERTIPVLIEKVLELANQLQNERVCFDRKVLV